MADDDDDEIDEEWEELLCGDDVPPGDENELFATADKALHPAARIRRMNNLDSVRAEMCRVYRYVRRGQLSAQTGVRMITMLKAIADIRKAIDIERKLIEIQKLLTVHLKRGRSNGLHASH
jgi:hypothetical protein